MGGSSESVNLDGGRQSGEYGQPSSSKNPGDGIKTLPIVMYACISSQNPVFCSSQLLEAGQAQSTGRPRERRSLAKGSELRLRFGGYCLDPPKENASSLLFAYEVAHEARVLENLAIHSSISTWKPIHDPCLDRTNGRHMASQDKLGTEPRTNKTSHMKVASSGRATRGQPMLMATEGSSSCLLGSGKKPEPKEAHGRKRGYIRRVRG